MGLSKRFLYPLLLLGGAVFFFYNEFRSLKFEQEAESECLQYAPLPPGSNVIYPCDVVVVVLTGSPYHDTRLRDIQETYMKQSCQSDIRKNILFISDVANDTIPTVAVPCANGYDASLCCKVINGWKVAYKLYPNAKYYIQVDDDSYLVMHRLFKFLATFNYREPVYTGAPYYITLSEVDGTLANTGSETRYTDRDLVYAAGWFGVISRRALDLVFENQMDQTFHAMCSYYFWPDIAAAVALRSAGVFFNTNTSGFHTGWHFGFQPQLPENKEIATRTVATHTFHETKLMFQFEQYFNATYHD